MVKAYEMESTQAKFPRILVDETVLDVARASRNPDHDEQEEENYVRSFLKIDSDNKIYIDYVSWNSVVVAVGIDNYEYPSYLDDLLKIIRIGFENNNAAVLEKYVWLHERYISAIEFFAKIPVNAPYRIENPEVCKSIESFPRLDPESKHARAIIEADKKNNGEK